MSASIFLVHMQRVSTALLLPLWFFVSGWVALLMITGSEGHMFWPEISSYSQDDRLSILMSFPFFSFLLFF